MPSDTQIHFASSLYDAEAVREATRAFAEVAPLTVRQEGDDIIVELGAYDGDAEILRDELCNHALYETILRDNEVPTEAC